jgi:chromate reductase
MCSVHWPNIDDLPLFNEDLENTEPETVTALKETVTNSQLVIIFTPEYNYGIPGGLKNAIDWLSRPIRDGCLIGRYVAIANVGPPSLSGENVRENLSRSLEALTDHLYPSTLRISLSRDSGSDDLGDAGTLQLYDWLDDLLEFTRQN